MSSQVEMNVPENVNVETLNNILIGFLKAGATDQAVRYVDAAIRAGVNRTDVSRNNKFFVSVGFMTREKRGYYKFTDLGAKYVQLLDWGRLDDARINLRKILFDDELVKIILDYIDIKNGVARDDLITKIATISNSSKQKYIIQGINAYIDLMLFSNIFLEENEKIIYNKDFDKLSPLQTFEKNLKAEFIIAEKKEAQPTQEFTIPININIQITDITDVEKVKELIKAIKEAINPLE